MIIVVVSISALIVVAPNFLIYPQLNYTDLDSIYNGYLPLNVASNPQTETSQDTEWFFSPIPSTATQTNLALQSTSSDVISNL